MQMHESKKKPDSNNRFNILLFENKIYQYKITEVKEHGSSFHDRLYSSQN